MHSNASYRFRSTRSALRHPALWLTMASADFCLPIGWPCDRPSFEICISAWHVSFAPIKGACLPPRAWTILRLAQSRSSPEQIKADRQISQGKARDLHPRPAAYTSLGPDDFGLWIPTTPHPPQKCLVCDSCSSGRGFASSFLPTSPREDAVAVRLGVPVIKASRGLSPPSHFPVRFRSLVDSARHGAARHAWRTSSSPGQSPTPGPLQIRRRRLSG